MKLKTLVYKIVVPEDAVDGVDECVIDNLYLSLEDVVILSKVRDARNKEIAKFKKEVGDE